MPQPETSLTLYDRIKNEIAKQGRLNKPALRNLVGASMTDRQFEMHFYQIRYDLQDEGIFFNVVPGQPGIYVISTREEVLEKAMNKSRLRVVHAARRRQDILKGAQKHSEMDEESRLRLNAEEISYGRVVTMLEHSLLRRHKRPAGLE